MLRSTWAKHFFKTHWKFYHTKNHTQIFVNFCVTLLTRFLSQFSTDSRTFLRKSRLIYSSSLPLNRFLQFFLEKILDFHLIWTKTLQNVRFWKHSFFVCDFGKVKISMCFEKMLCSSWSKHVILHISGPICVETMLVE